MFQGWLLTSSTRIVCKPVRNALQGPAQSCQVKPSAGGAWQPACNSPQVPLLLTRVWDPGSQRTEALWSEGRPVSSETAAAAEDG